MAIEPLVPGIQEDGKTIVVALPDAPPGLTQAEYNAIGMTQLTDALEEAAAEATVE